LLVLGQLALATVVMSTAAGVTVASHRLLARDPGWNLDGLYTCWLGLSGDRYSSEHAVLDFQRDLLERVRSLPGVEVAALGSALPNVYFGDPISAEIEGRPVAPRDKQPIVSSILVSADYFATLQIPVLRGAGFPREFPSGSPLVVIVNETMAQTFWPNENPIGKRLRFSATEPWRQVIGVVRDVRVFGSPVAPPSAFYVYRPLAQSPSSYFTCILRTSAAPGLLAPDVRRAVSAIDPDLPVRRAGSLRQIATESNSFPLLNKCLGLMAVISTGLAMLGVYAMLSQLAAQRTREFGVRIALGARPADIYNLVLRQGTILLAIGGTLGVGCSLAVSRLLHSVMAELEFPGLMFSLGFLAGLGLVTWLAACVPARRAARADPVSALRAE
jgi:predicted permease